MHGPNSVKLEIVSATYCLGNDEGQIRFIYILCGADLELSPITRPTTVRSINTFSSTPFDDGKKALASDEMKPSACTSHLVLVNMQNGRICEKGKADKQQHGVGHKQLELQISLKI